MNLILGYVEELGEPNIRIEHDHTWFVTENKR